jgi:hypothetical protein
MDTATSVPSLETETAPSSELRRYLLDRSAGTAAAGLRRSTRRRWALAKGAHACWCVGWTREHQLYARVAAGAEFALLKRAGESSARPQPPLPQPPLPQPPCLSTTGKGPDIAEVPSPKNPKTRPAQVVMRVITQRRDTLQACSKGARRRRRRTSCPRTRRSGAAACGRSRPRGWRSRPAGSACAGGWRRWGGGPQRAR